MQLLLFSHHPKFQLNPNWGESNIMPKNFAAQIIIIVSFFLSAGFSATAQTSPLPTPIPAVKPTATPTATPTPQPTATPKKDDAVEDGGVLNIESNLVVVPVSVVDSAGQPVANLTKQDFRLEEDGKNQTLEQITNAEQVPLEIALLFDVSATVDPLFEFEKRSAAEFLRDVMKPEDRATIFLISEMPVLVQQRDTAEKSAIKIQNVTLDKKRTAFFDTVTMAANYLKQNAAPRSRRVILTISDGEDTSSQITQLSEQLLYRELDKNVATLNRSKLKDIIETNRTQAQIKAYAKVIKDLQNADAVFYSVNPAGSSFQLNKISVRGQTAMQKFADETGGTSFLPKKAEDLNLIFRQISAELRAQYILQYYSDVDAAANKYVKLNVILPNRGGLRIRARQGYFSGKTQ